MKKGFTEQTTAEKKRNTMCDRIEGNTEKTRVFPNLFFKFRSLSGEKRIERVLEIIDKHELYFPSRGELNDPFEAVGNRFEIRGGGYAGKSISIAADDELSPLANTRDNYRILSLSEDCFSPLMWGLYADSGTGVCLCFRTGNNFSIAKKVEYPDSDNPFFSEEKDVDIDDIEEAVREDLLLKSHDWLYEKEWRIIKKANGVDDNRFQFEADELVAIIFGYKANKTLKEMIKRFVPDGVKLFKMHVGGQSRKLTVLPEAYIVPHDGTELAKQKEAIKSLPELYHAIFDYEAFE